MNQQSGPAGGPGRLPDDAGLARAILAGLGRAADEGPLVMSAFDRQLNPLWSAGPGSLGRPLPTGSVLAGALHRVLVSGRSERLADPVTPVEGGRPLRLTVTPLADADGAVFGVLALGIPLPQDVARQAELELARQMAEKANQQKSRFLAAASHDLRQPFQAMRLFLHLLEARLTEPGQHELAKRLGESLDAGQDLLNALLEISALEAATVTPSLVDFPVGKVLERLAGEFRPQAVAKGLRLDAVSSMVRVRSDPVLLDRILRNLLGNALRYTASGRILIGARRHGPCMAVEVWDTGRGIPADKLQAVFDEFVKLDNQAGDQGQGLGLGLAIVKRTAQLLGHPVHVRSQPGRGSCFSVLVPLAAPADQPLTIAVAEDDRLQLVALEGMLREWGFTPLAAAEGPSLLEAVRRQGGRPDLLITDYRLSGDLSGPQLVAQVRAAVGHPIPGILLTGDTHPETVEAAREAGLILVHKPIHPTRLHRAILAAVGKPS